MRTIYFTDIKELKIWKRGKVRDIYEWGDNKIIIFSTDRISAFDVIFPTPIPKKGEILNQISLFWMKKIKNELGIPTHIVDEEIPDFLKKYKKRVVIARKAEPIKFECIVRLRLLGSAWREYKEKGTVHGEKMPPGLEYGYKFPEPIFTPSTKEDVGHDINVDFNYMKSKLGSIADEMKEYSLKIAKFSSEYLSQKGIELLDTKFEFGIIDGKVHLIDEALTPDSSRFWVGDSKEFYDKEYLREKIKEIRWDKTYPAPPIPKDVIKELQRRYLAILKKLKERGVKKI